MSTPQRLSSQVSTDASPVTPRVSLRESMNFTDISYDAQPGQRGQGHHTSHPVQIQDQQRTRNHGSNEGPHRPGDLQFIQDKDRLKSSSFSVTEEMEEVLRKTDDKLKCMSLESEADSSYSSMELSSTMPSVGWEEELRRYQVDMPQEIQIGYFDALILYAEEDRDEAEKFRLHLINDIDIGSNGPVTAMLYDCPELTALSGSKIGHLANSVDRSTYVFMYLSKDFVQDKWMEFSSESCLMTAIYDEDKRWCVVPVYTEKRAKCSFKVPMGLNSLKGINYYNNDEFYKRGVARLIGDKVPVRKRQNEEHKIKQKKWLEEHKRKQLQLREEQKRVEKAEEGRTAQMIKWLKDETERLIENGMISDIRHSRSVVQLSSPNHSLPHITSSNSLKDILPQNPNVKAYFESLIRQNHQKLDGYTQEQIRTIQSYYGPPQPYAEHYGDSPQSWLPIHDHGVSQPRTNDGQPSRASRDNPPSSVTYPLPTTDGIQNVVIPKVLNDRIQSLQPEEQNGYVKEYLMQSGGYSEKMQTPSDVTQYQHIQTKEQLLHSYSNPDETVNPTRDSLTHAPSVNPSLNSVPIPGDPGNQPDFGALFSHQSFGSSDSFVRPGGNKGTGQEASYRNVQRFDGPLHSFQGPAGNLPNTSLLQSVEEDGLSFRSSPTTDSTVIYPRSGDKGKSLQSSHKGRQIEHVDQDSESLSTKKKKEKTKQEKHVHYTINVYNASSVQVGNQNMVKGAGEREPDSDDTSDDETESLPVKIKQVEEEITDPAHSTEVLKRDQGDSDEQGTRGETEFQQPTNQSSQGSCNMDAAMSSDGSQPFHLEQPQAKVTTPKVIEEEVESGKTLADQNVTNQQPRYQASNHQTAYKLSPNKVSLNLETTNQLPEGMEKLLHNESNLEASVTVEKSSLKDKIISDTFNEHSESKGKINVEVKRQDSRYKSETSPVVAVISPMRPKLPSDSGDCTEVKQLMQSDETAVKSVSPDIATREGDQTSIPPQLLTKTGVHCDNTEHYRSIEENTMFTPVVGGASNHVIPDNREVFTTQRYTNASELFYPNRRRPSSRDRVSPVPYGIDAVSNCSNQGAVSEGFTPGTGGFTASGQAASRLVDEQLEYDMCESDSFEGTVSTSGEKSINRSNHRHGVKGLAGNKQCCIS